MTEEAWDDSLARWEGAIRKGFWVTMLACFLFALAAWLLVR